MRDQHSVMPMIASQVLPRGFLSNMAKTLSNRTTCSSVSAKVRQYGRKATSLFGERKPPASSM
jgi:hypothetical protein